MPKKARRTALGMWKTTIGKCAETVKAIGDSLLKPSYQPENIDLIEMMQEVEQSLGCTVEYSSARILVARAGVAHQLAESKL